MWKQYNEDNKLPQHIAKDRLLLNLIDHFHYHAFWKVK